MGLNENKYLDMPESRSEWDARQLYVKRLQETNDALNQVKIKIELRDGGPVEIIDAFRLYFSLLRSFYRDTRFLFKTKEQKEIDKYINQVKDVLITFTNQRINRSGTNKKVSLPLQLEQNMENLHNRINQRRFTKQLVIPMKDTDRHDTPDKMLDGFDG